MRRGARWRPALALLLAVAAAAAPAVLTAQTLPALAVCLQADNLPYSHRSDGSGFDIDVAVAAARATERQVVPVWGDSATRIVEIDDSDLPLARLARGDCDAIFSVPGPAAETLAGHDALELGAPYYGAAFELLVCSAEVPPRFDALQGMPVAIQSQTVAHFALLAVKAEPRTYFSLGEAFGATVRGDAEAALLWGPALGFELRVQRKSGLALRNPAFADCRLAEDLTPPAALRWNLHVATHRQRTRLREDLDAALAELAANGELARIAARWGVPWHAPFERTHSAGALEALRLQP